MRCQGRTRDLTLYVGGDLPDDRLGELEPHLQECAACRVFLAELEASQAVMKDLAAEPVPEEMRAALRARLASARPEGRGHRAAWAVAAGLAAAALVVAWFTERGVDRPHSTTRI